MINVTGKGFFRLNNREKIEFTNTVQPDLKNFISEKIRTNDVQYTISKVRFKLTDTANNKSTNWISSDGADGQSISTSSTNLFGIDYARASNDYFYVQDSVTGSLDQVELQFKKGSTWLSGGIASFTGVSYDANDYVNEMEYFISLSFSDSLSQKLRNRLLTASEGTNYITPTKVSFKHGETFRAPVDLTQTWTWSPSLYSGNGANLCGLGNDYTADLYLNPPTRYELLTADDDVFDSGNITLSPDPATDGWLQGDTFDFNYETTLFQNVT